MLRKGPPLPSELRKCMSWTSEQPRDYIPMSSLPGLRLDHRNEEDELYRFVWLNTNCDNSGIKSHSNAVPATMQPHLNLLHSAFDLCPDMLSILTFGMSCQGSFGQYQRNLMLHRTLFRPAASYSFRTLQVRHA